jgi:hypothetical protein
MSNCFNEIQGVKKIAFYINKDVQFNRPDPSVENEIDIIAHATGSFVINEVNELPKWERIQDYSGNYRIVYQDQFTFLLHGIENDIPSILRDLRANRLGYITEVVTTGNKSYVFPAPVFLNERNTKQVDSHSWQVSLTYRVPTFEDYLIKLNTVLMIYSYILTGSDSVLGGSSEAVIG